jgi:hypothetical protein
VGVRQTADHSQGSQPSVSISLRGGEKIAKTDQLELVRD